MRKRDVILDFTSLLDVTLIIIFFFVLFSHFESEENKAATEAKMNELEVAVQEAEDREAVANDIIEQLEKEISLVRDSNERQASNIEEMIEYGRSGNIKILLKMRETGGIIQICSKNEVIKEIGLESAVGNEILNAIKTAGYGVDDTVFCDFVFNGSEPGTASAYRKITKGFDEVKDTFNHLYYSETDLSVGEE